MTSDQMIAPAMDMAGMTTLGAGAVPAEANSLRMGIKAYHGSPHDFDRFDLSKIGTGEGAQAYGHGLYFAENPGVAESYKNVGARALTDDHEMMANSALQQARGDQSKALENLETRARLAGSGSSMERVYNQAADLIKGGWSRGKMYEVNINADPAHFLDWDKPLSQMSPEVQQKLNAAWLAHPEAHARQTGENIYEQAQINLHRPGQGHLDRAFAAEKMNEAGIPGIKYLDQGSRGAGQGSSNYVVFNDKLIDILKKYGIAAGVAPALAQHLMDANEQ